MSENWEIQFIKPCRLITEEHRLLTPEYTISTFLQGSAVLINLDNCSIQRMELLPEIPNMKDIEGVGLLPLVKILQTGMVGLNAIGVNEMPDCRIAQAKTAYERFCQKFWPGHVDDVDATDRLYNKDSTERKASFKELGDGARCTYGSGYVSMLQIQNIRRNYNNFTPETQFEIYMHSIVALLDIVSAFEVEIAKYTFWSLSTKEINQLPEKIKLRRKDIRRNFAKVGSTIDKCREYAFDAAMDIVLLNSANLTEDLSQSININGKSFKLDNWIGTTDHKMYRICRDIHSVYYEGSNMKRLAISREEILDSTSFWKYVDSASKRIMQYRKGIGYRSVENLLERIDMAVEHVEQELSKSFEKKVVKNT